MSVSRFKRIQNVLASLLLALAMLSSAPASAAPLSSGAAPDFTVNDTSGNAMKLSDLRGKVVVLDFWSTWCGPCQASLPHTEDVAAQYASKGVVVLAVNVWDTQQKFDAWIPAHTQYSHIKFAIDPKGSAAPGLYGVSGIPTQFVIDASGNITKSFVGYRGPTADLANAIDAALVGTGSSTATKAPSNAAPPTQPTSQDVNAADRFGITPLMRAMMRGDVDTLKSLIAAGANVNAKNVNGMTAMYFVPASGYAECVKALLAAGADVNAGLSDGMSVLENASRGPTRQPHLNAVAVKVLIDAGANVNAKDNSGWTALMWAAQSSNAESIQELVDAKADVNAANSWGWTPLKCAVKSGSSAAVKSLLSAGANVNAKDNAGDTPLMDANLPKLMALTGTRAGDFTVNGVDGKPMKLSDYRGKVVVLDFWATWCGWCIKALPHTNSVAGQYSDKGVVVLAVNVWDTPKRYNDWIAANTQYPNIQFAIDTKPRDLSIASVLYGVEGIPAQVVIDPTGKIVHSLVGYGGESTELADAIDTALGGSPKSGHVLPKASMPIDSSSDLVPQLIAAGADVNAHTEQNWTALHTASASGNLARVKELIGAKANVNVKTQDGWTPLMCAAAYDRLDCVSALIQAGADPNAAQPGGATALKIAKDAQYADLIEALKAAGAKE